MNPSKILWQRRLVNFITLLLLAVTLIGCGGGAAPVESGTPGTIIVSGASPTDIPRYAYGQNYWMWDNGDPISGTEGTISALKPLILRAGGNEPDVSYPSSWKESEIDDFITYCENVGAEPMVQVSIVCSDTTHRRNSTYAADLVRKYKDKVTYWIIGNEPDLYAEQNKISGYTVNNYISDFTAYAIAMKAAAAESPAKTIYLVGPELSYHYDWLDTFLASCHDQVDVVTIHRYPFAPENCTIANALSDAASLRSRIQSCRSTMNKYGIGAKPFAITEAHITYDGDPAKSIQPASPQTFYAGMWIADTMGVALEEGLWTMAYWSTIEGWYLGFLDGTTKNPRPSYYALQMYTSHFGSKIIRPSQVPSGLSVYASRNSGDNQTILMVLNKTNTILHETIQFTNFGSSLGNREYDFPNYSITSLIIPDDPAAPVERWTYTQTEASGGNPPTHTTL